jgi:hypothetical protein
VRVHRKQIAKIERAGLGVLIRCTAIGSARSGRKGPGLVVAGAIVVMIVTVMYGIVRFGLVRFRFGLGFWLFVAIAVVVLVWPSQARIFLVDARLDVAVVVIVAAAAAASAAAAVAAIVVVVLLAVAGERVSHRRIVRRGVASVVTIRTRALLLLLRLLSLLLAYSFHHGVWFLYISVPAKLTRSTRPEVRIGDWDEWC